VEAIANEKVGESLFEEVGSMRDSIIPRSDKQKEDDRRKLSYILPEYF
jgi:5'-methylthioadenosine phosphorylase